MEALLGEFIMFSPTRAFSLSVHRSLWWLVISRDEICTVCAIRDSSTQFP